MPLQATSGAASYDAFGGGVPVVPNYIEDVFSTWLYNGDTSGYIFASSGVSIVSGGMMWVKSRGSATNNYIFSPSLTNANYYLNTNTTAAQSNSGVSDNNFEAVDNGGGMRFGGAYSGISSSATGPFASWTFRKQPKFFDVVTYTGNGSFLQEINHNLGSTPGFIVIKRTNATSNWATAARISTGTYAEMYLNTTGANLGNFDPSASSTSVFVGGNWTSDATYPLNASGATYVMYLFAHDAGGFGLTGTDNVISCGSYTGTGAAGNAINLGYEPQWVMVKNTSLSTEPWVMLDNMRGVTGGNDPRLQANSDASEAFGTILSFNSTGFTPLTTDDKINGSGLPYIYIAIRRGPMKVPTSGTSVLGLSDRTGTGANATVTGSAGVTDLAIVKNKGSTPVWLWASRLTGTGYLSSNATTAETAAGTTILQANPWDVMDGVKVGTTSTITNASSNTFINYLLKRAPSFMDVVCYTGTGSARTIAHNLTVAPELMIVKSRSAAGYWPVYSAAIGNDYILSLDTSDPKDGPGAPQWNSTTPTASVFSLGSSSGANANGTTFVNYLFATCAGVSKVGTYAGTGALLTVDCGFTTGARFILIKRIDAFAEWYVYDTARGISGGNDPYLWFNTSAAQTTGTNYIGTTSVGFQVTATAPIELNASTGTYLFLAIA